MKKRLLSLGLAAAMVLGMGVTAFAGPPTAGTDIYGFKKTMTAPTIDFATATTGAKNATAVTATNQAMSFGQNLDLSKGSYGVNFTYAGTLGDFIGYDIGNDIIDAFGAAPDWSSLKVSTDVSPAAAGSFTLDETNRKATFVTADNAFSESGTSFTATLTLSGASIDNKYFQGTAYAPTVSYTIKGYILPKDGSSSSSNSSTDSSTGGSSISGNVINTTTSASDFAPGMSLAYGLAGGNLGVTGYKFIGDTGRNLAYDWGTVRPANKQTITIWLRSEMFSGFGGFTTHGYLGSQTVRSSKIAVRTQVSKGSAAVAKTSIEYKGGAAYVKVKFVTEYVSVNDLDFDFVTYLVLDSKRKDAEGQGIQFYGTLANYEILVYEGDDYVDTSLGEIAYAQEFVPAIEVDLGSGVSIFTKFFKEKKYYGTATRETDEYDDVVFAKYPDIDNVVRLKIVGLNSTGDIVKLSTDYSDYYVYDKDMNYLGQSSAKLRFSERYYLANKRLNVEDDMDDEDEPSDDDYVEPGETGGDNGLTNANSNPGTGR